jgi:uncharacterized protein YceK
MKKIIMFLIASMIVFGGCTYTRVSTSPFATSYKHKKPTKHQLRKVNKWKVKERCGYYKRKY